MQSHQLFRGRLEDVHFANLLLRISQQRESGVLHVSRSHFEKDIYFQEGHIVFAKSNDSDERLGELLLRRGKITLHQFEDAASKIVPGMRLGTILVQEGHIKPNDLYQGVIDQVEEIIYSLFEWTEGEFEFLPGDLPSKEVITLSISTADVIRTGIGRIWRWSWVKTGTLSMDTVFEKQEMPAIAKKMMITPGIQRLLDLLEQPLSLREVLIRTGGNNFETCKMVWSLMTIGILGPVKPPSPEVTTDIFEETPAEESPATVLMKAPVLQSPPVVEPPPHEPRIEPKVEPPPPEPRIEPALEPPPPPEPRIEPEVEPPPMPKPRIEPEPEPTGSAPTMILPPGALPGPAAPAGPAVEELETGSVAASQGVELSFSDLADLTDQAEAAAPAPVPTENNKWEKSVERDVNDFNEKHRYLFEMLRIEMGAGVSNFLGKILKKAASKHPLVFEGVQMNEFGELNAASLTGNIQSNLAEAYTQSLDSLLNDERNTMKSLLDKKRLELIETGIARIEESQRNRK